METQFPIDDSDRQFFVDDPEYPWESVPGVPQHVAAHEIFELWSHPGLTAVAKDDAERAQLVGLDMARRQIDTALALDPEAAMTDDHYAVRRYRTALDGFDKSDKTSDGSSQR
jgi:hypothetical protein